VTNDAFLIKIIPPEGYNVYRLHVSRFAAVGLLCGLVALLVGALGVHAWQLHLEEARVAALQSQTAAQRDQLRAIDIQTDSLAGQLRDIQRQDAEIRRLLGAGAPPAPKHRATSALHAALPARTMPTTDAVKARLASLSATSGRRLAEAALFARLTHRVLNLRRLAGLARERMIAALPSLNPVDGSINAGFGWRVNPWPEFHRGVDLSADYGTPVHAAADGVVISAGWDGGFGVKVAIDHANGYQTWYAHLSRVAVGPGQRVRKGETIAYVGATGEATGPHLHYQVMLEGQAIDPAPYLNGVPAKVLATLPGAPRVQ
jgi:murein DD-endopeptidase MepM/ murein hydrolase activator NlpD